MFKFSNLIMLVEKYWQVFLFEGVKYTLILSAIAVVFGVVIGSLIAFGRLSKFRIIRWICEAYTELIRGTPLLLQLYLFVLVLPNVFSGILHFSQFTWIAISLCFNSGAYVSEIIRSGIQSVDKGQTEAARSLGMNQSQTMMKVVMPQAIKNILPAIGNEFVSVIKETSMASTFFVGDLMTSYLKVKGATYLAFECLIIVAVIYFVLTFSLSKLIGIYERRLNKA